MKMKNKVWDTLLHPVRLSIVQQFEIGNRALTIAELARELPEIPQTTLYRHVNRLVEAGILIAVGERRVHAALERIYALPEPEAGLLQSDPQQANAGARARAITTFFAAMQREFERSRARRGLLRSEPDATFVSSVAYLNDRDLAELERVSRWLVELRSRPAESPNGRRARFIALIDFPFARDVNAPEPAEPNARPDSGK
jgi:DNA-binding transcriptional ArsR family regulator